MMFLCQAEDGIRDLVRSRGLGDVYKRQKLITVPDNDWTGFAKAVIAQRDQQAVTPVGYYDYCLLYTSDAADERSSVDLGGRRIIKKKTQV